MNLPPLSRQELVGRVQAGLVRLDRFPQRRINVLPFCRPENVRPDNREMVFLAKPELCAPGVDLPAVLDLTLTGIADRGYQITGLSVVPAAYLAAHKTMERHYGVIADINARGLPALSAPARETFAAKFGLPIESANALGGAAAQAKYGLSDADLEVLWFDTTGPKNEKLAPGTYVAPRTVKGEQVFILNGFIKWLNKRFTAPGAKVIAIALEGQPGNSSTWADMRNNFIGATKPTEAAPGSFRRTLLERRAELGIEKIDDGCNGGHLSAGPFDGLAELKIWFGLPISRSALGGELLRRNLSLSAISWLLSNPFLPSLGPKPLFDLTENQEPSGAASLALRAAKIRRQEKGPAL